LLDEDDRKFFIFALKKLQKGEFERQENIKKIENIDKKNKGKYSIENVNDAHSNILVRIKKFIQNTFFERISSSEILDKAKAIAMKEKVLEVNKEERKGEFENPRQ